jgi:MSHA pilin protein MshC
MPSRTSGFRQGRAPHLQAAPGFTMIELIMVVILVGILAAVAATRFFIRTGFDATSYAEQMRAMARYAQKLAIAQNRNVWVTGSLTGGVALCYANTLPCPVNQQVSVPNGTNSGNPNTRLFCRVGGVYSPTWYCESPPAAGIAMTPSGTSGTFSPFYFNGLGKPFLPDDMPANGGPSQDSTFATTSYTFSGDKVSIAVTIHQETGYVD